MPDTITGHVKDIVDASMADRVAALVFRLNAPNVQASSGSTAAGTIHPTATHEVVPVSAGSFSVGLVRTTTMLADAWYELGIVWNDKDGTHWDYPMWQIRVDSSGTINEKIFLRPPGGGWGGSLANLSLVLLGLTEPPNLSPGQLWWKVNPNNPADPNNTGQIRKGV